MTTRMRGWLLAGVCGALAACLTGCGGGRRTAAKTGAAVPGAAVPRIVVIPKGTTHSFWKSVEAGAREAARGVGVEIVWKGPLKENDRAQQIALVEQFLAEGVAGLVLAPLDDVALLRPVRSARARGVPVVIIDSGLQAVAGEDYVSFVATDNRRGGRIGGEELARLLGGRGKVVLLRYQEGSASTREREDGFLEAVGEHPGMEVIVQNRYAGPTAGEAKDAAMNLLDKLRECDGIFCPNESSAVGMLLALRQANLAGKKAFVGFDASATLVEGLRQGEIQALVSQNPGRMGAEGVRAMVRHLAGEAVPVRIDTGVELVTPANLDDPAIRALVEAP